MKIRIIKKIKRSKIVDRLPLRTYKTLRKILRYCPINMKYLEGDSRWDGYTYLYTKYNTVPTGLLPVVLYVLKKHGISYEIENKIEKIEKEKSVPLKGLVLREYQQKAFDISLAKGGGVIQIPTGGGKSAIISAIIAYYNLPTVVLVHSIFLLNQMKVFLKKYLNIEAGIIGNGQVIIKKINIITAATALYVYNKKEAESLLRISEIKEQLNTKGKDDAIKEVISKANLLIVDECQIMPTRSAKIVGNNAKQCCYRYGFSATPYREDGATLVIHALLGVTIFKLRLKYLIQKKWLVPATYYIVKTQFKINFRKIFGEKLKAKKNVIVDVNAPRKRIRVYDRAKEQLAQNFERNSLIVKISKKLAAKRKVLVLVKTLEHGEILLKMFNKKTPIARFVNGSFSLEERVNYLQDMEKGKFSILIGTSIFDEGVDMPFLSALVLAGGGKSKVKLLQRIGRVLRLYKGKTDAKIIDFFDDTKYFKEHFQARFNVIKQEEIFKIKRVDL